MLLDTPLAPKDLDNPHKAVSFNRRSMSVLERSFYRQQYTQIQQWDEAGILSQAMSGQVPRVRRQYSRTLMDFFLSSRPYWGQTPDLFSARHQVLSRLWALGASRHVDRLDEWLCGCLGEPFADTLLNAGANPHAVVRIGGFNQTAAMLMLEEIRHLESSTEPHHAVALEQLQNRFMNAMQKPGAPQAQLDAYLGKVAQVGRSGIGKPGQWWDQVLVRLLDLGARPTLSREGALGNPAPFRVNGGDILRLHRRMDLSSVAVSDDPDAGSKLESFIWRESLARARAAKRTLRRLLQHRHVWDMTPGGNVSEYYWEQLLLTPGGVQVGRDLLAAGVPAPWQGATPANPHHSSPSLLANYGQRHPRLLERFHRLVDPTSVDQSWAAAMRRQYLARINVSSPNGSDGRSAHTVREMRVLLDALPLDGTFPSEMESWINALPESWRLCQTSGEQRLLMMEFLQERGLWAQRLCLGDPRPAHLRFSAAHATFVRAWEQHPQIAELIEQMPGLGDARRACVGYAKLQSRDPGRVIEGAKILGQVEPQHAQSLWQDSRTALAKGPHKSTGNSALWILAGLRESGLQPITAHEECELVKELVCCIDRSWSREEQTSLVKHMQAAGVDFSSSICAGIELLISQEGQTSNPEAFACLVPFVETVLEHGADLSQLREVEDPDRPLGQVVRVARAHRQLQEHAQTAHARHGQRRL